MITWSDCLFFWGEVANVSGVHMFYDEDEAMYLDILCWDSSMVQGLI